MEMYKYNILMAISLLALIIMAFEFKELCNILMLIVNIMANFVDKNSQVMGS